MKLESVLFLGAYTPRSQVYIQAMVAANLHVEYAVFFGKEKTGLLGQAIVKSAPRKINGLFMPDFSESLIETSRRHRWEVIRVQANNINDDLIFQEVKKRQPRLIIYSGYGGQIVGENLLSTKIPFLHIHSGWLPDYRGSTTLYYSWLKENFCGVSAILLNKNIDKGPVVARRKYAPPPKDVDPDYVYDSAIRADLLVLVLRHYAHKGRFPKVMAQEEKGRTYFVIHPVLKHLARLRIEK